ncbi:MAG: hypothetical protein L6433_02575 [Actinomycetia bacterium]|nr:hypothetical protein [Actinomycetes bacterium]
MSEYQYYEFHAVDRPLTQKQMAELRRFSSRARITPSSFVNVYNWGSFKGDPEMWMEKHFDAFLYLANRGSRWFMLRVPARLLEADIVSPYCAEDNLSCRTKGDHLILSFHSEEEDCEWAAGEGQARTRARRQTEEAPRVACRKGGRYMGRGRSAHRHAVTQTVRRGGIPSPGPP